MDFVSGGHFSLRGQLWPIAIFASEMTSVYWIMSLISISTSRRQIETIVNDWELELRKNWQFIEIGFINLSGCASHVLWLMWKIKLGYVFCSNVFLCLLLCFSLSLCLSFWLLIFCLSRHLLCVSYLALKSNYSTYFTNDIYYKLLVLFCS